MLLQGGAKRAQRGIQVHPRASVRIELDFLAAWSYSSVHELLSRIENGSNGGEPARPRLP